MISPADLTDAELIAAVRAAETAALDPETVLTALRDATARHLEAAGNADARAESVPNV